MQQCMKSGPAGALQLAESGSDQDAVLPEQWDDIGNGSDRHEIEIFPQIQPLNGVGFLHGMAELEDDSGTAEIVEVGPQLGVHKGVAHSRGVFRIGFMMIEDDQIASGLPEMHRFGARVGSAIHGDHEGRGCLLEAPRHAGGAQSVSLGGPVGNEALHDASGGTQVAAEDREGGDTVDIVVAVEGDPLSGSHGIDQTLGGWADAGDFLGRPQRGETRVEEEGRLFGGRKSPGRKQGGHHCRDPEFGGQKPNARLIRGGGEDPAALHPQTLVRNNLRGNFHGGFHQRFPNRPPVTPSLWQFTGSLFAHLIQGDVNRAARDLERSLKRRGELADQENGDGDAGGVAEEHEGDGGIPRRVHRVG